LGFLNMAATYSPRPAPRDPNDNRNARSNKRHDQGRFPAFILALVVHAIFFALLIFSVSWQVKPTAPLMAEVWDSLPPSLPPSRNAPAPTPPVPTPTPPAPTPTPPVEPPIAKKPPPPEVEKAPPQPTKAEIDLKLKQEREVVEKRAREEKELVDKKKADDLKKEQDKKKEELLKKQRDDLANQKALDNKIQQEQLASQARENQARAAQQAAQKAAASDYAAKVVALIQSRANIPDTVSGRPKLQVKITMFVHGAVNEVAIVKPSGNPVYDEAIERAIRGIQQWPPLDRPELLGPERSLIANIGHER
jgi:colicin import membrane protein